MESLQIRNVRSLKDSGRVALAPITLLLGQNSSGKSTFVRFLPLLKQGAESRTREPFLWLGRLVDFGSTEEALSRFAEKPELGMSIEIKVPSSVLDGRRRVTGPFATPGTVDLVKVSLDYRLSENTVVEGYEYILEYRGHRIQVNLSNIGRLTSLRIDGNDLSELTQSMALMSTWVGPVPVFEFIEPESSGRTAYSELLKFVRLHMDGRTSVERADRLTRTLLTGPIHLLLERAGQASAGDEYWRRQVRTWTPSSEKTKRITELVLVYQFFAEVSGAVGVYLRRLLSNIRYITPLRASAERYYRLQGLSIEEIDPRGENAAMFLHNLTNTEKANFGQWISRAFGVEVTTVPSQGHVSLHLRSEDSGQLGFNLADTGFGYSQILPILVQLWSVAYRRRPNAGLTTTIFAIEQPELHLHPRLQARLADIFLVAVKEARRIGIDLRLVIETHSEQIVSTLGLSIARGEAAPDDVNVLLFEKSKLNEPSSVSSARFGSDGILQEWPYGFFEATV